MAPQEHQDQIIQCESSRAALHIQYFKIN